MSHIEYVPWYDAGTQLMRCLECAALVSSGDTETHTKWHEKIKPSAANPARVKGHW